MNTPTGDTAPPASGGRLSPLLLQSTIVAALGGLLFGFDTAVISGATESLTTQFRLNEAQLGFTVASALIGTILGAFVAGPPADRYGRRMILIMVAVLYFVASLGTGLAWDWYSLLFFRFLGGIGVGVASVVSPLYIAEIAPAQYRGRLVATQQFNVVLGILLAYLSNYIIARMAFGTSEWRWMLGIEAVPSLLFFLLLFPTPESPRWLVSRGRVEEARTLLPRLGTDAANVDATIREITASLGAKEAVAEPFFQRKYLRPILLAVVIAAFNQLSGINALLYYAPDIFRQAGAGQSSALVQSVIVGAVNLVFTMAAMTVIDLVGRRKLMIIGSVGYLLSLGTVAWAFLHYRGAFDKTGGTIVLVSLLVFIASHAFSQGAVIWVFLSEIFPNSVRARGQALGSLTHWAFAALISWTFPVIAARSGGYAFAFYAGMMFLQLLWALFVMPETKGVPLEEMQARLGIKNKSDA